MMISDLPNDLIEEIFYRIPAKSLGSSRFTCKRWNALVKDPRFIKNHFDKAPRQPVVVTLMNRAVYSVSLNLHRLPLIGLFTRKLSVPIDLEYNVRACIQDGFHCDGLLLCTTMDDKLVVWNPCTGQTMWIKPMKPDRQGGKYALGYANNKLCRSYKILWQSSVNVHKTKTVEIFEFCSNSWRVLDHDVNHNCFIRSSGVSVKGHYTYWLATSITEVEPSDDYLLLRFDFTTESFRCMSLPLQMSYDRFDEMSLAVVREEELLVLHWSPRKREIEIWVSTKIIETTTPQVSWSNLMKVTTYNIIFDLGAVDARFFIDYDKKVVVCSCYKNFGTLVRNLVYIIGEEKAKFREIPLAESAKVLGSWPVTLNYVPSLARFQEGIRRHGHKRKAT